MIIFLIVAGVLVLVCSFIAYMVGFEHGRSTRIRQVAAIRDRISRLIVDPRTHPHTVLLLEDIMPLTTERE